MIIKEGSENRLKVNFCSCENVFTFSNLIYIFTTATETLYISQVNPLIKDAYVDVEFNNPKAVIEISLNTRTGPRIHEPAR